MSSGCGQMLTMLGGGGGGSRMGKAALSFSSICSPIRGKSDPKQDHPAVQGKQVYSTN